MYTRIPSREQHIGKRLAILRTRLNLSDADVAQRYGLPLELLPKIETGGPVPVDVAPKIRLALAEIGESQPGPVVVDAASRPADPPAPSSDDDTQKRGARSLSDADRELLEQLKPTREARGLTKSQAAKQCGLSPVGYAALEEGRAQYLKTATRAKLQAWLDNGTPNLSIVRDEQAQAEIEAGWREIETFAQVRPDDDLPFLPDGSPALDDDAPDPALEQHIREWQADQTTATPVTAAPEEQGVILLDLLAYFPEFDPRWSDAVALRWFDTFDNLTALVANETEVLL